MTDSSISKLQQKFEGFSLSNRNLSTYTNFLEQLSKKLKLGKKVGNNMLLTGDLYPRLTASIFENGILLNKWENPLTGELVGLCLVKNSGSKRPSRNKFVLADPVLNPHSVSRFTFDGKPFIALKEYNNSKELIKSLGLNSEEELKEIVRDSDKKMSSGKIKDDSKPEVPANKPVKLPVTAEKVKKITEKKVKIDTTVLLTACSEFATKMKNLSRDWGYRSPSLTEFNPYIDKRACATMEIRSWGGWEVPEDEEDDGDYDWKTLTSYWREKLSKIESEMNKKYPKLEFYIDIGEKEWISVSVSYKTKK